MPRGDFFMFAKKNGQKLLVKGHKDFTKQCLGKEKAENYVDLILKLT